ncbi:MAG: mannose-6-phosphate isomerase, class I [Treponema sp.]|jgi:mannose-6-phosphate isomerase|nr:mannose-6-phosphate isomerase, class I [Treponema sp.]
MPKTTLNIDVLGCSIPISAEEEEKYLNRLLEAYKKKLSEIRGNTGLNDPLKIAILTGFLLCDDCEKIRLEKMAPDLTRSTDTKVSEGTTTQDRQDSNQETANTAENKEAEKLTQNLIYRLEHIFNPENIGAIYKLKNPIKNYEWGSPEWIPELLGIINEAIIPCAEVWMGVHPEGPSEIILPDGETEELGELIYRNPSEFLGEERAKIFGGLPFLFKILAAEKPLSIQAHPSLAQAKNGWDRENTIGIPLDSPERNYKDPNHKPEIICALSPFTAMAGFREPNKIKANLEDFLLNAPQSLVTALKPLTEALEGENPLKTFLQELFSLSPFVRKALGNYVKGISAHGNNANENISQYPEEWKLISQFAELFPDDPAIISPLYLNLIQLNPGEALYLPAGILHAYIHGLGVELMANSNNVLRGGLTPKHIDIPELLRVLDFSPYKPAILNGAEETSESKLSGEYEYPVPCKEFSLSVIKGGDHIYLETGPSIILVTQGELRISGPSETVLKRGESAFIPAGNNGLKFTGAYTVYAAGTGPLSETNNANPG